MDRWAVLDDARVRLLGALAGCGVVRIEYVVGFVAPCEVTVWLGTETDAQRDAVTQRAHLHRDVADALTGAGLDRTDGAFRGVAVQSQETVDRDYAGSWFYALR